MTRDLPINNIHRRKDVRAIDDATVSGLMESIGSVGLINPIRVREKDDGWEVTAGSHRLEACKRLGYEGIACIVVDDDDLHAELAMIDENICRNDLAPTERARQTARRKAIYEELHPETKVGIAQAAGMNTALGRDRQVGDDVDRFTVETAKVAGKSERAIQRDAERGEKVLDEVKDIISGTHLDRGSYLDKIKDLSATEQVFTVTRDLKAPKVKAKPRVKKKLAVKLASEADITSREVSDLLAAWNRAGAKARAEFLEHINTPSNTEAA